MSVPFARPLGMLLTAALLFSCSQTPVPSTQETLPPGSPYAGGASYPWSDKLETPVANPYAAGRDYPWKSAVAASGLTSQGLSTGTTYLSDLPWTSATNSWGPVERDQSNGEMAANDGRTLTIGGQTYAKGLGTHASSVVKYALNGQCSNFSAFVGIDDEVGDRGRISFQVVGDGKVLFDSGELTGAQGAKAVSVSVAGVKELELIAVPGVNNYYDHGDWADAKITCVAMTPQGTVSVSDLAYTAAENGWGPVEINLSNGEQGQFDGRTLSINGTKFTTGLGVHAPSKVSYNLAGNCSTFTASVGVDDEVGFGGSVNFQVYGDGKLLTESGIMLGYDSFKDIKANVAGVKQLQLVVTDAADNKNYDHANWANAKLTCVGSTGTVDASYSGLGGVDSVMESAGTLVVVDANFQVKRLSATGATLASGSAGITDTEAKSIVRQADGKLVVVGGQKAVRFLNNLTLDSSFGVGGMVNLDMQANAVTTQPDGKIIVGGYRALRATGLEDALAVARLTNDGQLDPAFGVGGMTITDLDPILSPTTENAFTGLIKDITLAPDGKIVAVGNTNSYNETSLIIRYLPSGLLDPTFSNDGIATMFGDYAQANSVLTYPDGRILVGGTNHRHEAYPVIARFNTDGTMERFFEDDYSLPFNIVRNRLSSMAFQADGKIVAGVTSNADGSSPYNFMLRFNPDLTLDTTFDGDGRLSFNPSGVVTSVVLDSQNRIYGTTTTQTTRILP